MTLEQFNSFAKKYTSQQWDKGQFKTIKGAVSVMSGETLLWFLKGLFKLGMDSTEITLEEAEDFKNKL